MLRQVSLPGFVDVKRRLGHYQQLRFYSVDIGSARNIVRELIPQSLTTKRPSQYIVYRALSRCEPIGGRVGRHGDRPTSTPDAGDQC